MERENIMFGHEVTRLIRKDTLPIYRKAAKQTNVPLRVIARQNRLFREGGTGEIKKVPKGQVFVQVGWIGISDIKGFNTAVNAIRAQRLQRTR